MNGTKLKFGHLIPNNNKQFVVDGIEICCECGSEQATILTSGLYCRHCRSFRLFHNRLNDRFRPTGTVLDFD